MLLCKGLEPRRKRKNKKRREYKEGDDERKKAFAWMEKRERERLNEERDRERGLCKTKEGRGEQGKNLEKKKGGKEGREKERVLLGVTREPKKTSNDPSYLPSPLPPNLPPPISNFPIISPTNFPKSSASSLPLGGGRLLLESLSLPGAAFPCLIPAPTARALLEMSGWGTSLDPLVGERRREGER